MAHNLDPYCWSAITLDGALTGGYCQSIEECKQLQSQKWQWFACGVTPDDLRSSPSNNGG
jgi:hypothetical protein